MVRVWVLFLRLVGFILWFYFFCFEFCYNGRMGSYGSRIVCIGNFKGVGGVEIIGINGWV